MNGLLPIHAPGCENGVGIQVLDPPLVGLQPSYQRSSLKNRCDSSDCLYCQYQDDCALHGTTRRSHPLLLGRSIGSGGVYPSMLASHAAVPAHSFELQLQPRPYSPKRLHDALLADDSNPRLNRRRQRQSSSFDARHTEDQGPPAGRQFDPNPSARMVQYADLGPPPQVVSQDMIGALEFSPDGRLLASGSMAKQVRLYCLTDLFQGNSQQQQQQQGGWIARDPHSSTSSDSDSCSEDDGEEEEVTNSDDLDMMQSAVAGRPLQRQHSREGQQQQQLQQRRRQHQGHQRHHTASRLRCSTRAAPTTLDQTLSPVVVHRLPSKVSCMAWSPTLDGVVSVGDYDGVITQLHVHSGHQLSDVDAHSGRRIWGIAHSRLRAHLCASVSDDGTARLWSGAALEQCALVIRPPRASGSSRGGPAGQGVGGGGGGGGGHSGAVCGVDFSPSDPHLMALAAADHDVYLYDIRAAHAPLQVLRHHQRPASYVKFLGPSQLVSASTDASLAVWDITLPTDAHLIATQQQHQQQHQQQGSAGGSGLNGYTTQQQQQRQQLVNSSQWWGSASLSSGGAAPTSSGSGPQLSSGTSSGSVLGGGGGGGGSRASGEQLQQQHLLGSSPVGVAAAAAATDGGGGGGGGYAGMMSGMGMNRQGSLGQQLLEGQGGCGGGAEGGAVGRAPAPVRVLRGHRNERNFVGLAVRPEDGLIACGSESSFVYTYHATHPHPLALFDLLGLQARRRSLSQPLSPSSSSHNLHNHQGGASFAAAAAAAVSGGAAALLSHSAAMAAAGGGGGGGSSSSMGSSMAGIRRRYSTSQPFVSAVAWQPAAAAALLGLPALLAAGSSAGDIKLLRLQRL